ncbi:FAD-binding domain-containing protein [Corynespora cassiicola Philippines]|uniref:FAD-binding domain-containing protein n=1 Tax=Corynespora cassiicola Philippines TaxID=1448308 RepID=A0A2T2NWZ6_CORCC|nr:FAD-binding domain-containing protein [Corynespora cassiicola Philippines]
MGSAPNVYELLRKELQGTDAKVLTPESEGYAESIKRWSEHCEKKAVRYTLQSTISTHTHTHPAPFTHEKHIQASPLPSIGQQKANSFLKAAVLLPTSASQISTALSHIRTHSIPFVVRGGGHSTSGSSSIEDGLVIDLSRMRKVSVDAEAKTITAEGGTIWEDVDVEAAKYGLATVGGTVNHTGVGGLTLGGGYGYLTGKYGLTIDNLVSVDMVLASGEQVKVSETENSDLFWAVRGAGQSFGVVTAFTFQGHPQPNPVYAGPLVFLPDKLPQIVQFANKFHEINDGNQALLWGFSCPPPAGAPVVLTQIFYNGPEDAAKSFFADLISIGPVANMASMVPYEKLNSLLNHSAGFDGRKQFGGGAFKLPLDPRFVVDLHSQFLAFVESHERTGESLMLFETIPYKKVIEVGNKDMAFSNRGDYYNVATCFKWFDPSFDDEVRTFSRNLLRNASQTTGVEQDEKIRSVSGVGQYGNYATADTEASEIYGSNATRLAELKTKYDPENLFSRGMRLVPRPVVVVN